LILGALRGGNGQPVTTAAIVTAILKAGGHGQAARAGLAPRVRSNLAYLSGVGWSRPWSAILSHVHRRRLIMR